MNPTKNHDGRHKHVDDKLTFAQSFERAKLNPAADRPDLLPLT